MAKGNSNIGIPLFWGPNWGPKSNTEFGAYAPSLASSLHYDNVRMPAKQRILANVAVHKNGLEMTSTIIGMI